MPTLPQGRDWIAARLPHGGRMCLLDAVLEMDESRIHCTARSHRDPANPLRSAGRLGAACALEYAAQGMALHAATRDTQAATPRSGMLVAVREMRLEVASLDKLESELQILCERLDGDVRTLLYAFDVRCAGQGLARGRATLVIGLPAGLIP